MLDEQENIFDVPHSLPSSAHPVALATRTPTVVVKTDSTKYIPDYGGQLEVPGSHTKQYTLRRGIPFHPKPQYVTIHGTGAGGCRAMVDDKVNLVVATYLQEDQAGPIASVIRAVGPTLFFNGVQAIPYDVSDVLESYTYSQVPYPYQITGLKYCDTCEHFLLVKFEQGVKLMRLNPNYNIPVYQSPKSSDTEAEEMDTDKVSVPDEQVMDFVGSYPERRGHHLGDACLTSNQRTFAMTSSDTKNIYLKLYDVGSSRKASKTIVKMRDDNTQIVTRVRDQSAGNRRSLRAFVPIRQPFEITQQLENDPYHICELALTTSNRVSLVDVRQDSIKNNYVDRFRLLTVLPTEIFGQTLFSKKSEQQFYLLSNERLRVFDKRFLSQPIASMDHMLDPATLSSMVIKSIGYEEDDIETLCISSFGRLCFISFDWANRSQSLVTGGGKLINPRSLHAPLHDPSPADISGNTKNELYSMDITSKKVFNNSRILFSVYQLSQAGDIFIRGYEESSEDLHTVKFNTQVKAVIEQVKSRELQPDKRNFSHMIDLTERRRAQPAPEIPDEEFLNILDASAITNAQDRLTSKRAIDKFEKMKKLYKQ